MNPRAPVAPATPLRRRPSSAGTGVQRGGPPPGAGAARRRRQARSARGFGLAIVALLLALPGATAGTEADPEIVDEAELPRVTAGDIVRAWFSHEKDGIRFSIQTVDGSRPEQYPGFAYWVEFRAAGVVSGAVVGFDLNGAIHGHVGRPGGPEWERGHIGAFANGRLLDITQERGRPSTWSAVIPWGAARGVEPGATLIDLVAGSAYHQGGRWQQLDEASTNRAYVARPEPSVLDHPAAAALLLTATTLLGAGGGWWALARRRRPPRRHP